MAISSRPAESLSLKEVSEFLGVKPRKVQYLREKGVVVPDVIGQGRGSVCRYSFDDVVKLYIVLEHLKDLVTETQQQVLVHDFVNGLVVDLTGTVRLNLKCRADYEAEVEALWATRNTTK